MTVSGLRAEARRGRLIIERIAGKDYTTLANILAMRQLCQLEPKVHGCISEAAGQTGFRPGSSWTVTVDDTKKAQAAARAIVRELSEPSKPTSPTSTSPRRPEMRKIPQSFQWPTY
jgi:hypothetical protein